MRKRLTWPLSPYSSGIGAHRRSCKAESAWDGTIDTNANARRIANLSPVHWEMVGDLRREGAVDVGGEPFVRDGRFVV